jgi:hypothetical protein
VQLSYHVNIGWILLLPLQSGKSDINRLTISPVEILLPSLELGRGTYLTNKKQENDQKDIFLTGLRAWGK